MSKKRHKIKGQVGRKNEEVKGTNLMFAKAEALLEKYKTSKNIPPEEFDPLKTGFDGGSLLSLCQLIEEPLATKRVPVINQKPTVENRSEKGAPGAEKKKAGANRKADQKNSVPKRAPKLPKDEIRFVPMDVVAAIVLGNPKYNN
jgi:hypothetical protein